MAEQLKEEMVASYGVSVTGIERTKAELAKLTEAIQSLRRAEYNPGPTVEGVKQPGDTAIRARFGTNRSDVLLGGREDIFVAQIDVMEGRILGGVRDALSSGVAKGKRVQAGALRAAETPQGRSGYPSNRKSKGREVTGTLIKAISTNVEMEKLAAVTNFLGWHGWQRGRQEYFEAQELGSKGRVSGQQPASLSRKVKPRKKGAAPGRGIEAANSLGASIIVVREHVKRELGKLKK